MEKPGQRLLLALASTPDVTDDYSATTNIGEIIAALGGVLCLIFVLLMCTCKERKHPDPHDDLELQQSSKKGDNKATAQCSQDSGDAKPKADVDTAVIANGCTSQASGTFPGHSRQASSGSAHMRPTSLRELPEPPVSTHHVRNKSLSGVELLSTSTKGGSGVGGSAAASAGSGGGGGGGGDYGFHQLILRNNKNATSVGAASGKDKTRSDGYDHLGPKPNVKPTDYDSLAEPESTDGETPMSETGGGLDSHYSQLRERTYAVVGDVKAKAKQLFDPYSKVEEDKDDAGADYYSQVKEDPYNHISDSSGDVSSSFIRRLRQMRDIDDPYATVQEDSGSDLKSVMESRAAARAPLPQNISSASSWVTNTPPTPQYEADIDEEYAVVQKAKGVADQEAEKDGLAYNDDDISPYGMGPPEPPRLYNDYDSAEDAFAGAVSSGYKREHKYSKVTARESIASMSARNALNPYEVVVDLPENTYATVEGGSGDGVFLRGLAASGVTEKRLSQTSDTYAEIGVSGGGLSSSIISSSSSAGANNSCASVAPIPPSLDSLHLMTKSQTSSEGDRLSDRHLASPEDSGMSLNLWGDSRDDDEDSEDGYSTLKKLECSPMNSSQPTIPDSTLVTDEESGEVTLVPNYQTVKDCISDSEAMEETENDPNYESVDEMRAKVALLKARNASSLDSRNSVFGSQTGAKSSNFDINSEAEAAQDSKLNVDELSINSERRRRLDHDYEEVDLSPPSSPVSPHGSVNHTSISSYQITSISNTSSMTVMSHVFVDGSFDVTVARERAIQSHMYEELTEVRAKTSQMNRVKKGGAHVKNAVEDKKKIGSLDKRKTEEKAKSSSEGKKKEEKVKSSSEEKRKNASEDKNKSTSEDKHKTLPVDKRKTLPEDKRKTLPEDKRKTLPEDKRKNQIADKKKSSSDNKRKFGPDDKKKDGFDFVNGTQL